ncbi:acyltransferase [Janthinobacterium sp. 17J80-10]|uniref:acyltransferase family protein n=1 Tax=Janthinobacterium sp. 17J80-10 TaxID=2497863 RepID=UPI0010056DA9|nr:acyltransferase [Janthinobacterium sp. 17J80-10]QAU35405.1 acyltransferase [Janthinobacterium sp. 17J80-10]
MQVAIKTFDQQEDLQAIDAIRGYAILLVIGVHATPYIQSLVWPAKRVLLLGVYGVQLFFIASALTLLMSWTRSSDGFALRCTKFLTRRFFRIAPLYYLAIVFYWLVNQNKVSAFSSELLFATLGFYNAWSPYLIPTVPGWMPVPGGWSIGVEFCFYFLFPFLAISITSIRRALIFLVGTLLILIAASTLGNHLFPGLTIEQRENFLYFWPPNQLAIFAMGFLLYQLIKDECIRTAITNSRITTGKASILLLLVCFALSFQGQQKFFDWHSGLPPTHLLISLGFMLWALVLVIKTGNRIVINSAIVRLGKVSFSAYVLHFAILKLTAGFLEKVWPFSTQGVNSLPYAAILIGLSLLLTWCAASLSYRYVEQVFISQGKKLTARMGRFGTSDSAIPSPASRL